VCSCDVHAFATIILNSSRPWRVSVYTAEMLPYFVELQALCQGGVEAVKRDPIFAAKCWYNTPFMVTHENIDIAMRARELLGMPFTISTMPVAGIATPATLSGALVHITAEILGCNVITLALDDRLGGYCAGALTFDMKTGIHTQCGPDVQLLRNACAQMGAFIFGGEYRSVGGPSTAAKRPDVQSVMEKSMDTMWAVCGGVRSFGSLGTLAFADIGSPVQLLLDLEMMSHFERLLKGIVVDEDRMAEELICEVGPKGAYYLATDHTARYFREELWSPQYMDRRVPMAWLQSPADMLENARAKARQILAEAPNKCPLSEDQKAEVRRIVAAADAQVSGQTRR
jgi:trimethylamine--corrinoid protein Co-methyltransferase